MDFKTLKPGVTYKLNEAGDLVEAELPESAVVTEVPDEDLPPDMRINAHKAEQKIEDLAASMNKLTAALGQAPLSVPDSPQIKDEEKMAFLKSIISNKPYKKQFQVFSGKIKFTFRTLSTAELDAVSEALVIQSGRIPYSNMLALAGAHMRFCMAASLCDVEYNGDEGVSLKSYPVIEEMYPATPKKDSYYVKDSNGVLQKRDVTLHPTPGQKLLWAAVDKFAEVSVPLYNVLFEKYQVFDSEVLFMTKETADATFFPSGAGGSSY